VNRLYHTKPIVTVNGRFQGQWFMLEEI